METSNKDKGPEENQTPDNGQTKPEAETQPPTNIAQKAEESAQKELLYLRADFDNYKKRMIREQSEAIRMANKTILVDAISLTDLLDHALTHAQVLKSKGDAEFQNFVSGIEMTRKEFDQFFSRHGVEIVGKVGEKFDPEKHEAISQEPTTDDKIDTVLSVIQKGSLLNGKLVKPARVVVGTKS